MSKRLIAFHGKREIKDKYLARVRAHRKADQLVQGVYWEQGKGCGVGCTIHSDLHAKYERLLGIPEELALMEDVIFERLPLEEAVNWPVQFLAAIRVGADLTEVPAQLGYWLLQCLLREVSAEVRPYVREALSICSGQFTWGDTHTLRLRYDAVRLALDTTNRHDEVLINVLSRDFSGAVREYSSDTDYHVTRLQNRTRKVATKLLELLRAAPVVKRKRVPA